MEIIMDGKLHEIWEVFDNLLGSMGQVYICGGAVRDSLRGVDPKDYDIYIIDTNGARHEEVAKKIKEAVSDYPKVKPVIEFHKSEPFLIQSIYYEDKEVQIMVRGEFTNVEDLVDSFDWNVSLFAYGRNGTYKHPNAVDLEEIKNQGELKLNRVTFPYSTLRRGYRFSERFVMKLSGKEIDKIITEINKSNSKKGVFSGGGGI